MSGAVSARLRLCMLAIAAVFATQAAAAQTVLTVAQHFVGGSDDPRQDMLDILSRKLAAAGAGLTLRVLPPSAGSDPWSALSDGKTDIVSVSADALVNPPAGLRVSLLPTLVRDHAHAERLNHSPFVGLLKAELAERGVDVLAGTWFAGAVGSTKSCIRAPADARGLRLRAATTVTSYLWEQAGATIVSSPSAELHRALAGGKVDTIEASAPAFLSLQLYDGMKCLTLPGRNALWFSYQPLLMAKVRLARLSKAQQDALTRAAGEAEREFESLARHVDEDLAAKAKASGIDVVMLTPAQFSFWVDAAQRGVYPRVIADDPASKPMIDAATAVK